MKGSGAGQLAHSPLSECWLAPQGGQLATGLGQSLCALLLTLLSLSAAHFAEDTSDLLQHVKFQSSNFENILTWDSRPESAPDTVYSVQYKT